MWGMFPWGWLLVKYIRGISLVQRHCAVFQGHTVAASRVYRPEADRGNHAHLASSFTPPLHIQTFSNSTAPSSSTHPPPSGVQQLYLQIIYCQGATSWFPKQVNASFVCTQICFCSLQISSRCKNCKEKAKETTPRSPYLNLLSTLVYSLRPVLEGIVASEVISTSKPLQSACGVKVLTVGCSSSPTTSQ